MSPISFTLEANGVVQIQREFLRWGERVQETSPLWEQLVKDLKYIETLQFLTEGQHGSGGWDPLEEDTLKEKKRKGQPSFILRATQALFKSLTESGEGQVIEDFTNYLRFGTAIPYAGYLASGTRKMPRRPPMELTAAERNEIARQVQRFIVTGEVASIYG